MPDSNDLTAVEALLAERDSLRGWLDRLDASGVAAPESVRSRVRADYQARLDGLTERLRTHADAVASRLAADTAERDQLLELARQAREGLAEAELRHAVGEYDAARFEQEQARFTSELDGLEIELNDLAERIAGLEDVHAAVTRPAAPGVDPAPSSPELEVDTEVAPEPSEPDDVVPDPAQDDSDHLLSIFDDGPAIELTPPAQGEPGAAPPAGPVGFGPLSFTPNDAGAASTAPVQGRPARPAVPPVVPPIGIPGADQSPRFVRPAPERGSELVELPGHRHHGGELDAESVQVVPEPEPMVPESNPDTESTARTLRCGECGSMNRPLEWYCEKCGAELTTV